LLEEPFFDSETNSFVWLFAGLFDASESNRAPAQYPFLLSAYAFFEPVIPSLPILSSFAQVSFSVSPSSYAVEPVELCPGPEICIEYFGIECTCPLPGDETTPPDGGTTPPDSGTNPPDEDDEPPPSPCRGISYATPFPRLSGYIVEPVGEEVIVIAGDTLNLRANGSPDPDLDQTISRAPDPESGECSSSEKIIPGPSLSFIWRLWEDTDRDGKLDRLIGNIGYGKQISWRVPERTGVYYVELVVDDDGNPDKDNPPEEVKCAKCTTYSTADDPAVRDWVKVRVCAMDLDVDSDNNNDLALPDRSRWEEEVEDVVGDDHRPGKVLLVNDVDYDEDGIVDWADGFDLDPLIPDDDVSTNSQFVPVILEVSNIDFANAKIRIHYDASDPSLIDINAVDNSTMLPYLPPGKLRLWRRDGNQMRNKLPLSQGGDFVAPGVYSPAQLGLSQTQTVTVFFVEAVRASDQVADLTISVEIDPTGDKGFTLRDQVRLTAIRIEIISADFLDGKEKADYGFILSDEEDDAWTQEIYQVIIYDPRTRISPRLFIADRELSLRKQDNFFETPKFITLIEGTNLSDMHSNHSFVVLKEGQWFMEYTWLDGGIVLFHQQPEILKRIQRKIRVWRLQRLKPDQQMAHAVKYVVGYLINSGWTPQNASQFGTVVHQKVVEYLEGVPGWVFDVWVSPDGTILSIGGYPPGPIPDGATQIDALYLRQPIKVGEKFDSNKVERLYEIKSGAREYVDRDQITRLKAVMRGREVMIVRSQINWDEKNRCWVLNRKFMRSSIIMKGIVAAVGLQEVWSFINTDQQDELLDEMDQSINLIRFHAQQGNWEQVALEKAQFIYLLREFFEPISPSNLTNLMWRRLAEEVLSRW
jgi:hypothetical protein